MQSLYRALRSSSNHITQMRIILRGPLMRCSYNYSNMADSSKNFMDLVKSQLLTSEEVKSKQMELLSHVMDDINFANDNLQLTGEEVYKLGVATFQASKQNDGVIGTVAYANLFKLSHELGHADGSYTYGSLQRIGQGCDPDPLKAAKIFTDLAMKGHPYAQFTLAVMYYRGEGIEQSFSRAFTLFKVSAQNLVPQSFSALGDMYMEGQGIEEDKAEGIKCYKRAIELGDAGAHLSLAQCYNKGNGVEQSFEKTFEHYLAAAEAGLLLGIYNTGVHYFAGKGVEHSFEKAAKYFQEASDRGFVPAQVNLGNMYYNGMGVEKDVEKAKEMYKMAAVEDKNAKVLLEELEMEEQKMKENSDKK